MAASMPAQVNLNTTTAPKVRPNPDAESSKIRQDTDYKSYSEISKESSSARDASGKQAIEEPVRQGKTEREAKQKRTDEAAEVAESGNPLPPLMNDFVAPPAALPAQVESGQAGISAVTPMAGAIARELNPVRRPLSPVSGLIAPGAAMSQPAVAGTPQSIAAGLPGTMTGGAPESGGKTPPGSFAAIALEVASAAGVDSAPGNRIASSAALGLTVPGSGGETGTAGSYALLQTLSDGSTLVRANAPIQQPLQLPSHTNQWGEAIGQRVVWMASQNLQQATIRVHPQHLGPLEINLSLNHDQASVSINSPHAAVRDAIEASVPRMRELFAQQQMQLVQVDVGQRDSGNQGAFMGWAENPGEQSDRPGMHAGGSMAGNEEVTQVAVVHQGVGLLDDYA